MVEIRARLIVLEVGERLPILLGCNGMPMFLPTVWLVSMRRNASLATATLNKPHSPQASIYLGRTSENRTLSGRYLTPGAISSVATVTHSPLDNLRRGQMTDHPNAKIVTIEKVRQ